MGVETALFLAEKGTLPPEAVKFLLVNRAESLEDLFALSTEGTKEVMNFTRDHGTAAGLAYVAQKMAVLLHSDDLNEAMQAFVEKRSPRFQGR